MAGKIKKSVLSKKKKVVDPQSKIFQHAVEEAKQHLLDHSLGKIDDQTLSGHLSKLVEEMAGSSYEELLEAKKKLLFYEGIARGGSWLFFAAMFAYLVFKIIVWAPKAHGTQW